MRNSVFIKSAFNLPTDKEPIERDKITTISTPSSLRVEVLKNSLIILFAEFLITADFENFLDTTKPSLEWLRLLIL